MRAATTEGARDQLRTVAIERDRRVSVTFLIAMTSHRGDDRIRGQSDDGDLEAAGQREKSPITGEPGCNRKARWKRTFDGRTLFDHTGLRAKAPATSIRTESQHIVTGGRPE